MFFPPLFPFTKGGTYVYSLMPYVVISGEKRELDPPETWFCLARLGKGLRLENAELQEKRSIKKGGACLGALTTHLDLRNV